MSSTDQPTSRRCFGATITNTISKPSQDSLMAIGATKRSAPAITESEDVEDLEPKAKISRSPKVSPKKSPKKSPNKSPKNKGKRSVIIGGDKKAKADKVKKSKKVLEFTKDEHSRDSSNSDSNSKHSASSGDTDLSSMPSSPLASSHLQNLSTKPERKVPKITDFFAKKKETTEPKDEAPAPSTSSPSTSSAQPPSASTSSPTCSPTHSPSGSPTHSPAEPASFPGSSIDLYSADEQISWMTSKQGGDSVGYKHILYEERYQALLEVLEENRRLESEIDELKEEQALLEPMYEEVCKLKEMLLEAAQEIDTNDESSG